MSSYLASLIGLVCASGLGVFVALGFSIWMTTVIDRLMDEVDEVTE